MTEQYTVSCQSKEWYGDEDHIGDSNYGRYKLKGGEIFLFEVDGSVIDEQKIIEDFNKKYDKVGRYWRYEAKSIDWYTPPVAAEFIDGEVFIPYADPLDPTPAGL